MEKMRTFRILTLGCKVNQYESEALAQQFLKAGYRPAQSGEAVSVSVVNTCSVTNMSDRKSRKMIRQCAKDSELVAVCGCYAQAKPEEASQIEGVNLVIGNGNKHKLFALIEECLQAKEMEKSSKINIAELTHETSFDSVPITEYREKTRAILKIQDGCNSFCSYCIIPYVRGRLRSRNPLEILEEARLLAKNGYREIVLAGIHVCKYGADFSDSGCDTPIRDLTDLLMELEKIDGICRIRLSSIEPFAFHEKFFRYYALSKKLCPSFHISLQSGSDTVLKRMNRHYTADYYIKTVEKLREIKPQTTVTTDVIVGFPGETDEEFQQTLDLVKKVGFLKVHTFPYSRRSGTAADKMPDQIPQNIKEIRSKEVIKLSLKSEQEILKKYVGSPLFVLAEEEKNGGMYGLSENHLPVILEGEGILENKIYPVVPYRTDGAFLYAEISN